MNELGVRFAEALQRIASCKPHFPGDVVTVARDALTQAGMTWEAEQDRRAPGLSPAAVGDRERMERSSRTLGSSVHETDEHEIDPHRHRVWSVDVHVSYTTYVVAETEEEAEEIARAESGEDRLSADEDYYASELKGPLQFDGGSLPWGMRLWRDKELTVNEAVELIANPPPAGQEVAPTDTATVLMPFVDLPPTRWSDEEEASRG